MKQIKNLLWYALQAAAIAGAMLAVTQCSPARIVAAKPTPAVPDYNPFYDAVQAPVRQPIITPAPYIAYTDSIQPDGSHVVTILLSGEIKVSIAGGVPPKDTIKVPPVVPGSIDGIGINTFPWVPLDKLQMFSTLRCYIASGWIWRPGGLFVQPFYQGETAVAHGLDDYLQAAKDRGIDILPCVNMTPEWYRSSGNGTGSNDFPPIKPGLSRTDPKSYADYAEFWYQFVCRYGSVKHPDGELRVDQTARWPGDVLNVKKSGLGLIKAVEIGNEWPKWWLQGTEQYMSAPEQAAMLSAVYDAVKRADPNMIVVMGGLTNFELPYLVEMNAWFVKNRSDKKFASDVLNFHHYSNVSNELGKHPPTWKLSGACLPSQDKDFTSVHAVVEFGKSIGRPVWCTEFGADTKGPSWMHVHIDGMTDEEAQGKLLVETYKAYLGAGVQRCYAFMASDEPGSANGGLWQNCGLLYNQASGYKEKPSYWAVKALIEGKVK